MAAPIALVWLRRDLRLDDHAPLAHVEAEGFTACLAFVFDPKILTPLPKDDRRVSFFHAALEEVEAGLREKGSRLAACHGDPVKEIPALARRIGAKVVVASRDYEPYAKHRDAAVEKELLKDGIRFVSLKDQVIFESREILNGSGEPYKVFTAYKNSWLSRLNREAFDRRGTRLPRLLSASEVPTVKWSLDALGFRKTPSVAEPGSKAAATLVRSFEKRIDQYKSSRDIPSVPGTSGLSPHLRFGTISIRTAVRAALRHRSEGAKVWLSELVWRDFYHMVLDQFPQVGRGEAFRAELNSLAWPGKEAHFEAWCEGRTGFPLVDAAMRHFNATGWMHNRLRMVVASFLVKDLLIDWRRGEEYFAKRLLDFDLAANNGGWQWSASTGCDAQPYFRIFHPVSQSKRFDPQGAFIREHVEELKLVSAKDIHEATGVRGYNAPIVDHAVQRKLALALFKR